MRHRSGYKFLGKRKRLGCSRRITTMVLQITLIATILNPFTNAGMSVSRSYV